MYLSKKVVNMQPSQTLAAAAKAKELKDQGVEVLDLTLGEPDFTTPKAIEEAAIASIKNGSASFYTPATGLVNLKQAIINRTKLDYGLVYQMDEVLVGTGAKFVLYSLFQALLNPSDEVLVPEPYWVSYVAQIELAEAKAVVVKTKLENQYKVTVDELNQQLSRKTKALVLNTPTNPTGSVYTRQELESIGEWAVKNNIYLIADDIYAKLVYNGNVFTSIASISKEIKEQSIVINGVSKAYSMTGWRIGYVLGNQKLIQQMAKIVSQSTSNPAAVSQYAAIEALNGSQADVEIMRQAFEERLNQTYPLLSQLPGVKIEKPAGAFYFFPDISECLSICGYEDVSEWVSDLLIEEHVAVVSGRAFGTDHHIRLSYATDIKILTEAIDRIGNFIDRKRNLK